MIDENDAPEGYKATDYEDNCCDCAFCRVGCAHLGLWCLGSYRKDGQSVIFVKREDKQ